MKYMCHVLEHFGRHEVKNILSKINKVLKPNCTIRICVPHIQSSIEGYVNNEYPFEKIIGLLWGGQKDVYDYHKIGFTYATLEKLLEDTGFTRICKYDANEFLGDIDDYSKSYLPHLDFENGRLVSHLTYCVTKIND